MYIHNTVSRPRRGVDAAPYVEGDPRVGRRAVRDIIVAVIPGGFIADGVGGEVRGG